MTGTRKNVLLGKGELRETHAPEVSGRQMIILQYTPTARLVGSTAVDCTNVIVLAAVGADRRWRDVSGGGVRLLRWPAALRWDRCRREVLSYSARPVPKLLFFPTPFENPWISFS
ncbi:unnamed protein product [Calypogeia fissa]